jgi:hypothetical protein
MLWVYRALRMRLSDPVRPDGEFGNGSGVPLVRGKTAHRKATVIS